MIAEAIDLNIRNYIFLRRIVREIRMIVNQNFDLSISSYFDSYSDIIFDQNLSIYELII